MACKVRLFIKKENIRPGTVAHAVIPMTWKAAAGGF